MTDPKTAITAKTPDDFPAFKNLTRLAPERRHSGWVRLVMSFRRPITMNWYEVLQRNPKAW